MSASASERVPHDHPFRFVERVDPGPRGGVAVALATSGGTLTGASPWPVTLVAEALAQAVLLLARPERIGSLRLVGLGAVKLHQSICPGDRLEVDIEEQGAFGELRRYLCRAHRAGALAATAEVTVSGA